MKPPASVEGPPPARMATAQEPGDSSTGLTRPAGVVSTEYYSFVDALRGVAILGVIAAHANNGNAALLPTIPALATLVASGARGVQLFFILSAFTLLSTSFQRFSLERRPRLNFYLRRAFRILPLWWAAVALFAVSERLPGMSLNGGGPPSALETFLSASFLFGLVPGHGIVRGGWSLFVEESFYLMLPLLYERVTSLERSAWFIISLLALSVAWFGLSRFLIPESDPAHVAFRFCHPAAQWFVFGYGFVFYYLYERMGPAALSGPICYLADLLVAILLWATLVGTAPGPALYTAATALLALCVVTSQHDSLWRKGLDNWVLRSFGRCCYSIYLLHSFALPGLARLQAALIEKMPQLGTDPNLRYFISFVLLSLACLLLGNASFYLFERPLVRLGRRAIGTLEARASLSAVGST